MGKSDARIELGIAGEPFLQPRHAHQHQAEPLLSCMSRNCSRLFIFSRSASSTITSSQCVEGNFGERGLRIAAGICRQQPDHLFAVPDACFHAPR